MMSPAQPDLCSRQVAAPFGRILAARLRAASPSNERTLIHSGAIAARERGGTLRVERSAVRGSLLHTVMFTLGVCLGGSPVLAMPSAPEGVLESGAPSFVVLGSEALGLSTGPIDIQLLPDGRVVVVSQRELAFGDGVRWETFRGEEGEPTIFGSVAIDTDGTIYAGIESGFGRIELRAGGHWGIAPAVSLPEETGARNATLVSVVTFPDHWYWYGGSGPIVSWRPGLTPQTVGNRAAVLRILSLEGKVFVSDESSGGLYQLTAEGRTEHVGTADMVVSNSVTCATSFGPGQLLVGTGSAGLKLFDGKTFRPFGQPGLIGRGLRITDLCPVGESYFAAAIDTVGIIFFDREGRMVQVLERSLDHRLGRVKRLLYTRTGVLWALMNDGVARVEFPSPISHFEPLVPSGLRYAQPLRHAGRLWMLADGRAMRGIYDDSDRLERFEDDTPPGRFLFTMTAVDDHLFGSNDEGTYLYEDSEWKLILPGVINARVGVAPSSKDGMYYVARGEYGTIQHSTEGHTARRIPMPDLGDSYGAVIDSAGIGWVELGTSRVGRIDPHGEMPVLKILGADEGIVTGWVEIYVLDGIARFHAASRLQRFDDSQQKFVEDQELLARLPQLATAGGRPTTDSLGRLWYTADGAAQLIDRTEAGGDRPVPIMPVGFAPTSYTPEDDGIIWMYATGRLARMDLRMPEPPVSPLRALITSVQFSASNRQVFAPGAALAPIDYAENSLVIHFAAPANPFAVPVTFEVLLEGAGTQWISTGAVGSAAFNRLKEGNYVFHVRPVVEGTMPGTEAQVQFTVRPPWFRTPLAWASYAVATVGIFAFAIWLSSFLQRRENERLERLVTERTGELQTTNDRLAQQIEETLEKSVALSVSEERYRLLNADLEIHVQDRTAELEHAHKQLLISSRQAGMAEVAIGVLHNVGNVLNSVNVSSTLVRETLHNSEITTLSRVAGLLRDRAGDMDAFLTTDPKGRLVPGFVVQLADQLAKEHALLHAEHEHLARNVEHIKGIVAMQQTYARVSGVIEKVRLADLVGDALQMHAVGFARHGVEVVRDYADVPLALIDQHKVMQILVNLINNAKHSLAEAHRVDGRITVKISRCAADRFQIAVTDNGVGISAENLTRVFSHGFTTRRDGHGFGLHSGANAAREMGGSLRVESAGAGLGATFTLELPVKPNESP